MEDDQRIIHLWSETLLAAYSKNATDIHIEPHQDKTLIRFRVDGSLFAFKQLHATHHDHLSAHIKVLANLDIAEKRLPQDGRLSFYLKRDSTHLDCRIATVPTIYGEKIVVRLLTNTNQTLHIDHLQFDPWQLQQVKNALLSAQGLILITGPTGSGKTSTLYSCLTYLNNSTRNISTVEDPPEIRLAGINQISLNEKAGFYFPKALRALLRQDPDVIMIGEIRDFETAQIALQAAQTGHLVLASVHTNNSVATISRLHHLGCEKDVLANSLLLITAQRLVRKICQHCLLASQPCNYCSNVGYIGRMAIHEVMPFDFTIRQLIQDSNHLYKALSHAKDLGMLDLWSQGMSRVEQGLTSQQEIIAKIGQSL